MDLLTRLQNHIAGMAPHQRDRHAGKLLIEAEAELKRVVAWIERTGNEHDFCTHDAHPGKLCTNCNCHLKNRPV